MEKLQFLRLRDVAKLLAISPNSVRNKFSPKSKYFDPEFPSPIRIGARTIAFDFDALIRWKEKRATLTTNKEAQNA